MFEFVDKINYTRNYIANLFWINWQPNEYAKFLVKREVKAALEKKKRK